MTFKWIGKTQPYFEGDNSALASAAYVAVSRAIKRGEIIPPLTCEECGDSGWKGARTRALVAHHDDYAKPLSVEWLCTRCHKRRHYGDAAEFARKNGLLEARRNFMKGSHVEHTPCRRVAETRGEVGANWAGNLELNHLEESCNGN